MVNAAGLLPYCIRSPNFPSSYGNSQRCTITPTALAIGRPLVLRAPALRVMNNETRKKGAMVAIVKT